MQEAARWFADHESGGELDGRTLPLWDEWWADPENRKAYGSLVNWHQRAAGLTPPRAPTDEELQEDLRLLLGSPGDGTPIQSHFRSKLTSLWHTDRRRATAAVCMTLLVVVVGIGALMQMGWLPIGRGAEHEYATGSGEQRDIVLDDGSVMTLGGDTSVTVKFTRTGRLVVLGRGEGMFRVRHERNRSFSVCARTACATAVGTIFDVHLYTNHVRVWVEQGAIDVGVRSTGPAGEGKDGAPDSSHWTPVRLRQGHEMSYDPEHGLSEPVSVDARSAGAWTQGIMAYRGRPLGEVVEDVQRYSRRQLILDPATTDLTYSGTVAQQRVDQWIAGLAEIFPVEAIDCRNLLRSGAKPDARSSCAADPNGILIRLRQNPS